MLASSPPGARSRFPWNDAARRALPLFAGKCATLGMTLAAFAIVARHLGPGRFGPYSVAYGLPWLVLPVVDFGFSSVVAREVAAGTASAWAVTAMQWTLLLFPLGASLLFAGGWLVGLRGADMWLLVASASQLAAFTMRPAEAVLVGQKRTDLLAVSSVAANTLSLGGVILATMWKFTDAWILAAHAGYAVVYYAAVLALVGPGLALRNRPAPAVLWREAWAFGAGGVASSITERAGTPLVLWLLGPAAAGLYGAASRLYELGVGAAGTGAVVLRPFLGEVSGQPEALLHRAEAVVRMSLVVSGTVALGVAGAAPVLIGSLFGPAFPGAGAVLVAMAPAIAAILPGSALSEVCIAARLRRRFSMAAGWALAISVGGAGVLTRLVGVAGPALALGIGGSVALGWVAAGLPGTSGRSLLATFGRLAGLWWSLFGLLAAGSRFAPEPVEVATGVVAASLFLWCGIRRMS